MELWNATVLQEFLKEKLADIVKLLENSSKNKMTNKKKEKIQVDKTDFDAFLKSFKELTEKYNLLFDEIEILKKSLVEKQIPQSEPKVGAPEEDFAFWCVEIRFGAPKTPQELAIQRTQINEFRKELEVLMREYKVGQVQATILKKL